MLSVEVTALTDNGTVPDYAMRSSQDVLFGRFCGDSTKGCNSSFVPAPETYVAKYLSDSGLFPAAAAHFLPTKSVYTFHVTYVVSTIECCGDTVIVSADYSRRSLELQNSAPLGVPSLGI